MRLTAPLFRLRRDARHLSRTEGIPLNAALDRLARQDGFRSWAHMHATVQAEAPLALRVLDHMPPGSLTLLAARPGHGKTMLGLELALLAAEKGGQGLFFTLDYSPADVRARLRDLGRTQAPAGLFVDTSDAISAASVARRLQTTGAEGPVVAVIDYLQLLDQRRSTPPLQDQVARLRAAARDSGAVVVAISQVDRGFDACDRDMPGLADIRLPNPVDLTQFDSACFLHEGRVSVAPTV